MKIRSALSFFVPVFAGGIALMACNSDSGGAQCTTPPATPAGDGTLKPFTPPDPTRLTAGQLLLTASGEALAQQGYNFPDTPDNGVFADGWEVRFQHFIAIFDKITISNNPDKKPTDQSQTDNQVAEVDGPWIIDLSKPTAKDVPGKEQGEMATPFAVVPNQNLCGNQPFLTNGTKYAVGFSAVAASTTLSPINVNLDAEGQQMYQEMLTKGCAVLYDGTATFKADATMCTTQDPAVFGNFPPVVHFHFCFKSPTDYINCDNQDIQGMPFGSEPHPRGVAFPTNRYVTGEITFHTDHPFWESVVHDTPAHFDQFAARVAMSNAQTGDGGVPEGGAVEAGAPPDATLLDGDVLEASLADSGFVDGAATEGGAAGGGFTEGGATEGGANGVVPVVTLDDVAGVDYLAYTDKFGSPVQWRSCVKDKMGAQYGKSSGRMSFDPTTVPKAPQGPNPTTAGLRDYRDYTTYNQSTQGHWNGVDGLCFVRRNYPAPN
jgi:hypothetical protein